MTNGLNKTNLKFIEEDVLIFLSRYPHMDIDRRPQFCKRIFQGHLNSLQEKNTYIYAHI